MHVTLDDVQAALQLAEFDGTAAQQKMMPQARVNLRPPERPGQPRLGGVLLLLYQAEDELYLVLTRRRDDLQAHAGQVSFPGGRHEAPETLQTTALRETFEEIGIPAASLRILGELSSLYILPSDFEVHPFVAYYENGSRPRFVPDPHEVAEIIEVPLSHLFDPSTRVEEEWELRGYPVSVPFFQVNQHKVWGATAMMLSEFLERLRRVVGEIGRLGD
jgi:8-oxo-dGTP pyrophosphatase MutT (NUDIX family)